MLIGGYDKRVQENVDYLNELDDLATNTFNLATARIFPDTTTRPLDDAQVIFVCSFNDAQRTYLLANSEILLYTPTNEHFGITPVEGMYASVPVIATNTGGPLETIKDKETGLLLPPDPKLWADGIGGFISGEFDGKAMGRNGRSHVKSKFSLPTFADQLDDILEELMSGGRPTKHYYMNGEFFLRIVVAIAMVYIWYQYCL